MVLRVLAAVMGTALLLFPAGCAASGGVRRTLDSWDRVARVSAYDSPRRARYPSITKARDGSLVVLFTRQTADEERAGLGALMLVRSQDAGRTWSDAEIVFEGRTGEPRAINTMATLASGRIVAPFTELSDAQATSTVRMLSSDDGGGSWQVADMRVTCPLAWWAPCGNVIETVGGTLVMPIYGAASQEDLAATIHNCGLLRSRDGGKSWGDFSWIARGGGPMIGAAAESRFSFEGPSVLPLPDGRWLAMVSVRRLNKAGTGPTEINEGPGAPQELCRLWTSDQGRTWTEPEQFAPGNWPCLARIGRHTFCVNTIWAAWGDMRLLVSDTTFATFFRELRLDTREWLKGMLNRMEETPSPPTVPHLAPEWPFEHYGFPSAVALDEDNLIVVHGRPQRGSGQIDRDPKIVDIPREKERIQATFFRRTAFRGELAPPLAAEPTRPRGRWVLAERIPPPAIGGPDEEVNLPLGRAVAQTPEGDLIAAAAGKVWRSLDGGRTWSGVEGAALPGGGNVSVLGVLSSGRWLAAKGPWWQEKTRRIVTVGERGGFPLFKMTHAVRGGLIICWSDDQGRTWGHTEEPFKGPFISPNPSYGRFVETADGGVLLSFYGSVTGEEQEASAWSIGVMRSSDRGETWGDFSFVYRAEKGPGDVQVGPQYCEHDIVALPNGKLVAFARLEYLQGGPRGWGVTEVKISADSGRTWKKTGGCLLFPTQTSALALPDGGIAFTYRASSWRAPGVAVSYDEGRSFNYMLTGPYETVGAFVTGAHEFVVFTSNTERTDGIVGFYRFVPAEQ